MPKMEGVATTRKISVDQIDAVENVRADYRDIEDLAESIRKTGQLQAVIVKEKKGKNGQPRFELIAGFRRLRAFYYLIEKGEPFTSIDATIVTGDNLTIQLVENIQRSDLTSAERERGIFQMKENGFSQIQIAEKLSKTKEWVSRNITAFKIRKTLDDAGINTAEISTGVLNEIQTAESKDLPGLIQTILDGGGTQKIARAVMQEYREKNKPPRLDLPAPEPATETPQPAANEPLSAETENDVNIDPLAEGGIEIDGPESAAEKEKPAPRLEKQKSPPREYEEPEHKMVDVNDILAAIYKHIEAMTKKQEEWAKIGPPFPQEYGQNCFKLEEANDIIAIIHKAIQ
jgi:ParB family chromosome partitioning protein